jgi:predicted porin
MKGLITAGVCLASYSCVGHAQSIVSLYGVIDVGFVYNNNAHGAKQYSMVAGSLKGNRWGLLGKEDLGGGYKAVFLLENGFSAANGALAQGGAEFGRQAYAGLSGPAGTITLGRQYDSIVDYVGVMKAGGDTVGGYASHPGDLDNTGNSYRVNNAIKFTSPDYRGITFGGVFSPGGIAGDSQRNRIYSLGMGYKQGPLSVGAAYLVARNPNFSYYGNNPASSVTGSNMALTPIYSGYASAQTQQTAGAAAAYTFGNATAGLVYTNAQFSGLGSNPALNPRALSGEAVFNTLEANLRILPTPAIMVGASYAYTRGSQVPSGAAGGVTYQQLNVGAEYFLSKRTGVYAVVFGQHAKGRDSTGGNAVAAVFGLTPSSSNTQVAATVGLRHKF